jgi:hypothetical protein
MDLDRPDPHVHDALRAGLCRPQRRLTETAQRRQLNARWRGNRGWQHRAIFQYFWPPRLDSHALDRIHLYRRIANCR